MFAIFIIFAVASAATAQFHCYYTDPLRPQLAMFSTITAFDSIRGNQLNLQLSTCTPARLWLLSRGGSRLPDVAQINTMQAFSQTVYPRVLNSINAGRTQLCAPKIIWDSGRLMLRSRPIEIWNFLKLDGRNLETWLDDFKQDSRKFYREPTIQFNLGSVTLTENEHLTLPKLMRKDFLAIKMSFWKKV